MNKSLKAKSIFFMIFISSFIFSDGVLKNSGLSVEVIGGRLDVLNVYGPQFGLRLGYWPTSLLNLGIEGTAANNMYLDNYDNKKAIDEFYKLHLYSSLHLRFFKHFHPYIITTYGMQNEKTTDFDHITNRDIIIKENKFGPTIKIGLSLESERYRLSLETGGGNLGTGHVVNNLAFSYAIQPPPVYQKKVSEFDLKIGYHTIFPFSGPYKRENIPGFDIIVETKKNGNIREYNAGIFFTDYLFSTGVFNIGTGWRLDGKHPIFDYVDITPGIQVLIWAEGDPDVVLPAASLGIGVHTELGNFIPFINTRTLATYSAAKEMLIGTTATIGIDYSF